MGVFDAGEPPSFFLPLGRDRADDLRNGFGWLAVDQHVIWLNLRQRDRAGAFGPPISIAVTPDELCAADVRDMLLSWEGEPYGLELLHDWTPEQMRCLEGLAPQYLQTSENRGQSRCDQLVEEGLLAPGLRGLALHDCSTESVRALSRLEHLELLYLGGAVRGEAVSALGSLPSLRSLWLTPAQGEVDALTSLAALPVERVALSGDYTPTEADLAAIGRMPALSELYSLAPASPGSAWPVPDSLRSLDVLTLDEQGLSRVCASEAIRELRVGIAEAITDAALECLRGRESLEVLRLGGGPLSAAGMEVIGTLTGLRELDLSGAPIEDLTPLRPLRELRVLRLVGTGIDDGDLAVLSEFTGLRTLLLRETDITSLTPLESLIHLHHLDASFTGVTDDSLPGLSTLIELHELGLHQTEVSAAALGEFRGARPDVLAWGPGEVHTPSR